MTIAKIAAATAAAGMLLLGAGAASAAGYDGGTVTFQYYAYGGGYSGLGSPTTFSAPGSTDFYNYFNVSVAGDKITYTYLGPVTWSSSIESLNTGGLDVDNGSVIYSDAGVPPITGVTLDPTSNLGSSGFDASDVSWNANAVGVKWGNLSFDTGDTVVLDVFGGPSGVPEPATWAMLLVGFGTLGVVARARRSVHATA